MTCGQGITSERACLFHKVQGSIRKHPWSSFTFLVLPSVVSSQKRDKFGSKNAADFGAAGSVCTRYARYPYVRSNICACAENMSAMRRGCCSRMTFDRLVSPPKNEPVRVRTSICVCGQRAFQNRYIFRPDDAREERKVRRYSVLSSLTVERKCEEV